MKRSTLIFIITTAVIYGGIIIAIFILPLFGIRLLPSSHSRTSSSVNTIKIPEYYKEMETSSPTPADTTASKLKKSISCAMELDADSMRNLILHRNFFCCSSTWSGKWANPGGTGVRTPDDYLSFSDSTTIDTLLHTMWQRYPTSDIIPFDKTDSLIDRMNSNRWQGFDDWRLPTVEELMSLMVPVKNRDGSYLPGEWTGVTQDLWSCNMVADQDYQDHQWVVRFSRGRCNFGERKIARALLAVRDR